jgi:hypothetical protein
LDDSLNFWIITLGAILDDSLYDTLEAILDDSLDDTLDHSLKKQDSLIAC